MLAQTPSTRRDGLFILAALLIGAGMLGLVAQVAGYDLGDLVAGSSWTLFVIVPGLVLLGAGLLRPRPVVGLAIGGSIVTSVGLLLLYQDLNAHYESWSYAWALIGPGAAGLGLTLYALRSHEREALTTGLRLMVVSSGIFLAGAWYFETVFRTGRLPFDFEGSWPVVLVGLGVLLLVLAFVGSSRREEQEVH
jgi:hypothetical protein